MNPNQNSNDLLPIIGAGLFTLVAITSPMWLPALFGEEPKSCECEAKIGPSGIIPSCECFY